MGLRHLQEVDLFAWSIFISRFLTVVLGASLAGTLVREVWGVWWLMNAPDRWLFFGLFVYSVTATLITAFVLSDRTPVAPYSFLQYGFVVSLASLDAWAILGRRLP